MAYEKRLCVLKQLKKGFTADGGALTGAVYAERLGGELVVTPRIAGLSAVSDGKYVLAISAGGESRCFELKGNGPLRVPEAPSLERGFSALVAFVRGEAEPVAYGFCGNAPVGADELLSLISRGKEPRKSPVPVPMPPNQIPGAPSPQVPLAPAVPVPEEDPERDGPFRDVAAGYDDEAIAKANYFRDGVEDEDPSASMPKKTGAQGDGAPKNAPDGALPPFRLSRGGLAYYKSVEKKLKEAFSRYPRDESLCSVFPHSEWVKTNSALLGVVYAEGVPRFLCVAAEEIPGEAKEHALFVPAGAFSEKEGVYVVFQDADTGEYVKAENA